MKIRAPYPGDISRDQFEVIRPAPEGFRRRTKPGIHDLYDIYCGILSVTKRGAGGRLSPMISHPITRFTPVFASGLPNLMTTNRACWNVYWRNRPGRPVSVMVAKKTTFIIIDAQSVDNTGLPDTKGYDAGKKVSGIRRHIVVDTNGLPHAIAVTAANVTDRNGGLPALSCRAEHLSGVKKVLVDGGYTGNLSQMEWLTYRRVFRLRWPNGMS